MNHLTAYMAMSATRDTALTSVGLMALAALATWYLIKLLPQRWASLARRVYLLGGVGVFVITSMIQIITK